MALKYIYPSLIAKPDAKMWIGRTVFFLAPTIIGRFILKPIISEANKELEATHKKLLKLGSDGNL
jgi:hypothetical protein